MNFANSIQIFFKLFSNGIDIFADFSVEDVEDVKVGELKAQIQYLENLIERCTGYNSKDLDEFNLSARISLKL